MSKTTKIQDKLKTARQDLDALNQYVNMYGHTFGHGYQRQMERERDTMRFKIRRLEVKLDNLTSSD